jgi:hypothetical protein
MLARQATLPRSFPTGLRPFPRYCCELFVARAKVNSFAIKHIRTLCAKCPGVGGTSVHRFSTGHESRVHQSRVCPPFLFIFLRIARRTLGGELLCVFTTIRIARGCGGQQKASDKNKTPRSATPGRRDKTLLAAIRCHSPQSRLPAGRLLTAAAALRRAVGLPAFASPALPGWRWRRASS